MESKPHPQGAGDLPYKGGLDRLSTQKLDHDNNTKADLVMTVEKQHMR